MAILRIGRYLMATRSEGYILEPTNSSLEFWSDADFSGNWNAKTTPIDRTTAKSRTGYMIIYAVCPLTWAWKMQTETALSTTEAELIALSKGLRTIIPIMSLMVKMQEQGVSMLSSKAEIKCTVFGDNSGALTIATLPKIKLRTKYINTKYWHFRKHLEQEEVEIHLVSTKDQIADLLTKPLEETDFEKLKGRIMVKEHGDIYTSLKGSVENNEDKMNAGEHTDAKYNRIPVQKDKAVLGSKKREWVKAGFKTRANSASPNVNWLGESTTLNEEPIKATMQFGDISDDKERIDDDSIEDNDEF